MSERRPITLQLGSVEHALSFDEARHIIHELRIQLDSFKVKCPTCRCRIASDRTCSCCAEARIDRLLITIDANRVTCGSCGARPTKYWYTVDRIGTRVYRCAPCLAAEKGAAE